MENTESVKKHTLISAICFGILALFFIASRISTFYYGSPMNTAAWILLWIGLIGLTIALFIQNKTITLISTCITCLANLLFLEGYFALSDFIGIFAYLALIINIVLSSNRNELVKRIWFIPGLIVFLRCIIFLINIRFNFSYILYTDSYIWGNSGWVVLIRIIVESIALFFAGLWLKDDESAISFLSSNKHPAISSQSPVLGGAEKLKALKELLDSGAITQEEFDEKKKQILG